MGCICETDVTYCDRNCSHVTRFKHENTLGGSRLKAAFDLSPVVN